MAGTMSPSAPILNQVLTWPSGCHLNGDSVNKVQKMNPKGVTRDYTKQKQSKIINFTGNAETCPRIHSSRTFLLINFIYYVLRDGFPFARFWMKMFNDIIEEQKLKKIAPRQFSLWKWTGAHARLLVRNIRRKYLSANFVCSLAN